jgi:hypothetical protein
MDIYMGNFILTVCCSNIIPLQSKIRFLAFMRPSMQTHPSFPRSSDHFRSKVQSSSKVGFHPCRRDPYLDLQAQHLGLVLGNPRA